MNLAAPFIARPVATTLLTVAVALAGILAYLRLPVSPLPEVDFPTISVQASLPGASPDTVATSVASPLERHLGQIADVTEMSSQSSVGSARVTLQFGLDRNIDGAARDVQAAINSARADLPASLRQNPSYHKVNPADAPILILALTSPTLTRGQMYDAASNILQQRLSQLSGIGQVIIGGSALPAVRVELDPEPLFKYGIGLEDVRAAIASANANAPKGAIADAARAWQLYTNDQATRAIDYEPLVIAYRNGAAVRLRDVAQVRDSVEDLRNAGLYNNKPSVLVILFRQPGANIISTVDGVRAVLPQLRAALPAGITLDEASDRTITIRASLADTQRTLVLAVLLVTAVVFAFLRDWRATLVPAVAVPVSIVGTFAGMYLLGFSLDNLSLMALTIATGFVVDDAVVVLENVTRHLEAGLPRREAALRGTREVGFTVLSISLSLVAVFIPILLMGGLVGRLFREFALTLSMAIMISLVVSLTTTPMLCALLLRPPRHAPPGPGSGSGPGPGRRGRLAVLSARLSGGAAGFYADTLRWCLRHNGLVLLVLAATVALNVGLLSAIPKGLFPQQDTGRMVGRIQADQSTSFTAMSAKLRRVMRIVSDDPAIQSVVGFTGGGGGGGPGGATNTGSLYIALKPLRQRSVSVDQVIARLRPRLARVPGARLYLQAVQDIRAGGRQSNAQYEYTLQDSDANELYRWGPKLLAELQHDPNLADVSSDQQQAGLETDLSIDRDTASRLGLTVAQIDNTLYDAFGQRQVSTIYKALNQYHVVMELAPRWWQDPGMLDRMWVSTSGGAASGTQVSNAAAGTVSAPAGAGGAAGNAASNAASNAALGAARNQAQNALATTGQGGGASAGASVSTGAETMVPLAAVARHFAGNTPLAVNHLGPFVSSSLAFNLPAGVSLGQASASITAAMTRLGAPSTLIGEFSGTAKVFADSLANEPLLIAAALAAVYVVLGILYESTVHPITILSTLPSAGVGAALALILFHIEFSIIALIGMILLIGIVKKNAILMIDFALAAERAGADPETAIFEACMKRARPILMTTMAALLGALPLALSFGDGGELRRPLGVSIVGGLIVSQALTLYTTPALYLALDRFRLAARTRWRRVLPPPEGVGP